MPRLKLPRDAKSARQITEHYEIEKELAQRLMSASQAERMSLYGTVYNELFQRLPEHPQLVRKSDPSQRQAAVRHRLGLIGRHLGKDKTFLEIGPGDCALTRAVAERAGKVFAVDVSTEITAGSLPANVDLILSDGRTIDVPPGSVDIAYSDQLMEHLHPDDALEQLANIVRALKGGGMYVCLTPNRLTGPHDISAFFSEEAQGFHLREYTNRELNSLFRQAGFQSVDAYLGARSVYVRIPVQLKLAAERLFEVMPKSLRAHSCKSRPVRAALEVVLAGRKGG